MAAAAPDGRSLVGRTVRLDPASDHDAEALFDALDDDRVWEMGYGGAKPRPKSAGAWRQAMEQAAKDDRVMYVVRLMAVADPHGGRVEMTATLENPGVVVLADVYYPGWKLTVDGAPAPIYRVNRMMRGAAVPAGVHKLVYSYEPASFRIGGYVTLAGLGLSALLAAFVAVRPRSPLPWSPVDRVRTQGD